MEDRGYIIVKGIGLAQTIEDGGVVGVGCRGELGAVDVGVNPKGPEGVVEIEDEKGRERRTVCEETGDVAGGRCRGAEC